MNELELKYGCNPNQKPARIFMKDGGDLPIQVLNGKPGYINFAGRFQLLAAGKGTEGGHRPARRCQLQARHLPPAPPWVCPSAIPTGRSILWRTMRSSVPIACAYVRARGADRLCSYGDWAALSDVCDADTARYLKAEVSDGIIAPGYTAEALEILKTKKKGGYNVIQIDPDYIPAPQERKDVFGVTFEQGRNNFKIDESLLTNIVTKNKELPEQREDRHGRVPHYPEIYPVQFRLLCEERTGHRRGRRASRAASTAPVWPANKADNWYLRQHPKVLGLQFVDDIRRPDRDNAIDVYTSDEYEDRAGGRRVAEHFQGEA